MLFSCRVKQCSYYRFFSARFVPVPRDKLSEILSLRDEGNRRSAEKPERLAATQTKVQGVDLTFTLLFLRVCKWAHSSDSFKRPSLSPLHTQFEYYKMCSSTITELQPVCVCVCYLIITRLTVVCLRFLRSGKCEKKQIALSNTHESIQTPIKQSSRFLCCLLSFKDEPNTSSAWIRQRNI